MAGTEEIFKDIFLSVYAVDAKAPYGNIYVLRPVGERYRLLASAGYSADAILLVDRLLSAADSDPILAKGEYPEGGPKTERDIMTGFSESLRQMIAERPSTFRTRAPAPELSLR